MSNQWKEPRVFADNPSTGAHTTLHSGPTFHTLSVTHDPHAVAGRYSIRIGTRNGDHQRLHQWRFPSGDDPARSFYHDGNLSHYLPAPSAELRQMIEHHHTNAGNTGAWAALLDKLVEEYPDHFDGPVSAHTAARYA